MNSSPFDDERQGARWQIAAQEANRIYSDLSFSAGVRGMEMRRLVIEEVHADHDTEEA